MTATPDPEWIALLRAQVAQGRSIAAVAKDIGMPRPSLSMLLAGNYPAGLDRVTAKYEAPVLARFRDQVPCPHLGHGIGLQECRGFASATMSTSSPDRLRHWAACRACPHNPLKGDAS